MKATSLMKWLKGIEKIITKRIGRHLIRQAMSDLIETNDRFTPESSRWTGKLLNDCL